LGQFFEGVVIVSLHTVPGVNPETAVVPLTHFFGLPGGELFLLHKEFEYPGA